jgi:hypothetical protein
MRAYARGGEDDGWVEAREGEKGKGKRRAEENNKKEKGEGKGVRRGEARERKEEKEGKSDCSFSLPRMQSRLVCRIQSFADPGILLF